MFKLKRLVVLLLCFVMLLSSFVLTSCDSNNNTPDDTNGNSPEITAKQIHTNMTDNEIILFKASHAVDLGRVVSALEKESEKDKE